ncbi:MAG: PD-(D/E)XK nuclease family protein, partial [Steroidobacteraceae bacterium]
MLAHLQSGGWLLTRNLRQARILRRLHDRAQIAAGHDVWPTAQLLPLDAWLEMHWREAAAKRSGLPGLLQPAAVQWLWRQQVGRDTPGLIDPAELAAQARASWIRLRTHGGDITDLGRWPLTRDQQAFLSWARAVEAEFRDRNVCDPADLARLLVDTHALPLPGPPLMFSGFRRLPAAQSALVTELRTCGWTVDLDSPATPVAETWSHAAADPEAEQGAALAWIRYQLARRPDGIHGLIVPDLTTRRAAVERALASALQAELELPGGAARDRVFDLAGGYPLLAQPVVEAAMTLLACTGDSIPWATAGRLLRSPHVAGATTEWSARIQADLDLRSIDPSLHWTVAALRGRAERAGAKEFASMLAFAAQAFSGAPRRKPGSWAEAFGACLNAWGWPGSAQLDSHEFQAAQAFRERLHTLARLDTVVPELTATAVLHELRCGVAAPFQPERGEPSLFVLDTLDDPGIRFDSLWVAGLTAAAWPRPAAVDPLLPIEVQRRLGMPGVTADDCVSEARAVIGHWQSQCGELVLSWPRRENDTDVDASPLVPATAAALPQQPLLRGRERLIFAASKLEPMPADPAPPRQPGAVRGGVRVLELQSQCPFRAFAELRLGARPFPEPQAGIERRTRGTILHRALREFWSETQSLAGLLKLEPAARRNLVATMVDQSLAHELPAGTSARSRRLERDWQCRAIENLLAIEQARPDFAVAEAERSMECELGGLVLKLQVDRVDRIGQELLVIDYKTGKASPTQWRGARMDAPQLPLYAVLHAGRPTGIAVARVGAAGARFLGVATEAAVIDGLQPAAKFKLTEEEQSGFGWRQIGEHWYAWLERLARDHVAGRAEVDPKRGATTCRQC